MLIIHPTVRRKLATKHNGISDQDIEECFTNRSKGYLIDTRAQNQTTPITLWFISETDNETRLKVVFVGMEDGDQVIKTAYPPSEEEERIYEKYAK